MIITGTDIENYLKSITPAGFNLQYLSQNKLWYNITNIKDYRFIAEPTIVLKPGVIRCGAEVQSTDGSTFFVQSYDKTAVILTAFGVVTYEQLATRGWKYRNILDKEFTVAHG